ncbi:SDR family oxidoreductase [Paenibacillus mucilaginosus]|uniref:Short-chain dehydrogenase/reductase SDR n=1 Tax=Paenibacillus mucilaginosus (strain KNP414) TaxID=1036673 RepID=F8F681_PAEMK|nr:SDR family oxidoreductase [Paenibacillus mucilaginosus]AEI42355.1 short-chain dehydrogenase/reductase SDR [Paenibacillus mucilaginosus KNP414]MCG7214310.1 SDR family oxidoreductase [Paenibacillus mucilaginosus]WDM28817.1 SDR family oxidoreductase [Paenibacillus mucilaginosus]
MSKLLNKVAIVTGGSRGIGRAIAQRLGREGATVAVHYASSQGAAEEVVEEIKHHGGSAFAVGSDLGTLDGIQTLYDAVDRELLERFGTTGIDILVNNAGAPLVAAIEDTKGDEFDSLMSLNVKAPFFMIQQALPRLRKEGRIIQLSSAVTRISLPAIPAYSMSKAAINALTLSLANQLGPRGITINAIAPGFVATDMNAGMLQDPGSRQFGADYSIFGRWGEPGDIADIAAFLASSESGWITGQVIDASGGSHL